MSVEFRKNFGGVSFGGSGGSTPTLDQVATAGNTTAQQLNFGGGTLTGQLNGPGGNIFDDGIGNMLVAGELNLTNSAGSSFVALNNSDGSAGFGFGFYEPESIFYLSDNVSRQFFVIDRYSGAFTTIGGNILDDGAGSSTVAGSLTLSGAGNTPQINFETGAYIVDDYSGGLVINASQFAVVSNNSNARSPFSTDNSGIVYPPQFQTGDAIYAPGGIYFDANLNKLRIGGVSGWETVTSL